MVKKQKKKQKKAPLSNLGYYLMGRFSRLNSYPSYPKISQFPSVDINDVTSPMPNYNYSQPSVSDITPITTPKPHLNYSDIYTPVEKFTMPPMPPIPPILPPQPGFLPSVNTPGFLPSANNETVTLRKHQKKRRNK